MSKVYLSSLQKKYKIAYVHNPKHFYPNSLYLENLPDGRKLLCAVPRPHSKQFHRLAILTPINSVNMVQKKRPTTDLELMNNSKKAISKIFRDDA